MNAKLQDTTPAAFPFRPLFLAAAGFASVGMLLWGAFLRLGYLPARAPAPVLWHGHAMLFGFAGALIGGFLLTAVGNWTGRSPTGPIGLAALCLFWLLARIFAFLPVPLAFSAAFDVAYFLGLALAVGRVIIVARNRRNYFVILLLLVYAGLDITFFIGALRDQALAGKALVWTVDWLTLLMCAIGGRVIPFFTSRRMPQLSASDRKPMGFMVNAGVALALISDVVGLPERLRGGVWLLLAVLVLVRMQGWKGWRTLAEPMLWSLHLGYLWLALGMLLRGAALLGLLPWPETTSLHGITVGALGTLSLSMMTRVSRGHGGAPITAGKLMVAAFLLPTVAVMLRLAGNVYLLPIAASTWAMAYLLFLGAIGPLLLRRSAAEP